MSSAKSADGPSDLTGARAAWARAHDLELAKRLRYYQPVVLDRLASLAAQTLGGETSAILAGADASSDAMTVAAISGADPDLVGRRFAVDSGLAERVLAFGRPMTVSGSGGLGPALRRVAAPGAQATAAAPIHFAGRPAGLLSVSTTNCGESLGENELAVLAEFAELCGLALGHHERRAALAATAEIQVRALETALGVWDGYTAEHSQAVVRLALRVGQRLGMNALDLVELDLAARLHDIGKIRVPGDILRKPGQLSPEERQVIELHAMWGTELAGRIPGLQAVAAIIGFHHERPDGNGYPHRLAGERIPLASSIVAACDAYGAMTEHRPYRPALSAARTLAELRSAAGRQFHPEVVAALRQEVAARPLTAHNEPPASAPRAPTTESHGGHTAAPGSLSTREREVLTLIASGASGEDAAAALGLSRETIRTHVRNAIGRLNAHTRTHAVALAIESGQISLKGNQPQARPVTARADER